MLEKPTENFESMKEEALMRMEMLGLDKKIIHSYATDNVLKCSENGKIIEVPDKIIKEINEWQEEFGNLVFHVIHSFYFGETYECLSVSGFKDDWTYEENLIHNKRVMSHVINITQPSFTESGSIGYSTENGTLLRIM